MEHKFDVVVIGTGSAASTAASRCRAAEWSVAIVDKRPFGGTCALRGCDPKKVLVKLEMKNIEYTEPHAKKPKGKIEIMVENWYSWFLRTIAVQHDASSVLKKLRQTN